MLSYIPQPVPFYTNTSRQLFRQDYAGNVPHFKYIVLLFSDGGIPPTYEIRVPRFQIKRAATGAAVTSFLVKTLTGTTVLTLPDTGFEMTDLDADGTYEALTWNTSWVTGTGTTIQPNTYYYFQVSDGTNTWYSESFYTILVDNNTTGFPTDGCTDVIRINWALDCDIQGQNPDGSPGGLVTANFSGFDMFIEADPGKPEYQYEEEGESDANGVFIPDMRRVQKRWKIEFIGDERIADAVNMIPLFDTIVMYYQNGDTITFGQVNVDTEWLNGSEARLTLNCSTDYGIRQGCCPGL